MSSKALTSIPDELIQEIALHLPSTYDVLAFHLTNQAVRNALCTAALHKRRVALAGWDTELWEAEHEESPATADEHRMRWLRIDHMHSVLQGLMLGPQLSERVQITREPRFTFSYMDKLQGSPVDDPEFLSWAVRVAEVLPPILAHNVYLNVWRLEVCTLWEFIMCTLDKFFANPSTAEHPRITVGDRTFSYGDMVERLSFSLSMFFGHARAAFIYNVVQDFFDGTQVKITLFNHFLRGPEFPTRHDAIFSHRDPDSEFVAIRNATCFMVQATLYAIHLDPRVYQQSWTVPPPSLPPLARGADWSFMTFEPRQNCSRPWLPSARDLLLAHLAQGETAWVGYYSLVSGRRPCLDPPMRVFMRTPLPDERNLIVPVQPADGSDAGDAVEFVGRGLDNVGSFRLMGRVNMQSGIVDAMKSYETHSWTWTGILTPFGIVGKWGSGRFFGWFWLWPEEWSKRA